MVGESIPRRRICWPDPDATCLEGGCSYCQDHLLIAEQVIENWAAKVGQIKDRCGDGTQDALKAFHYGRARGAGRDV